MNKRIINISILVALLFLTGCASVPMEAIEDDAARKLFPPPTSGMAGLYIFRNSNFGSALTKAIYVNDKFIGKSAPMTYFYKEVEPGSIKLSTQSEFSNNDLTITTESDRNYFLKQYIKLGLFILGANIELVSEEEGKKGVLESKLAKELVKEELAKGDGGNKY